MFEAPGCQQFNPQAGCRLPFPEGQSKRPPARGIGNRRLQSLGPSWPRRCRMALCPGWYPPRAPLATCAPRQ
eukprot:11486382-Alexandrium_andersonii.AAC.1